ncbi:hypothetical protein [Nioella aestuarii]|uniref:hypothetical protein n=1 Tax=Nioella aestuarii TaxID=1662864 RepID=UPI003D7FCA3A
MTTLVLLIFPIISVWLFGRLHPRRALLSVLILGYLFLPPQPAGFTIPLIPPLTKDTIPSLVAIIACLALYRDQMTFLPTQPVAKVLVLVFIFSPMGTVLTNMDTVQFGSFTLPALRFRSGIAQCINQALLVAPLLLARNFFHSEEDIRDLMWAMAIAGLVYSLPLLLEVRLSPQLNIWIYGYFQHSFAQMMRGDGFRPIVFLYHGLWAAFLVLTALLAMTSLARSSRTRWAVLWWACTGYLGVLLILCKSMASILYGLMFVPVLIFLGVRMQLRIAMLLACVVLAYPTLKSLHLVPEERILTWAESVDEDRANSLRFRLDNETVLIDRAMERPVFGWGSWGRNHLYNERNGEVLTTTDGRWVITIGVYGWVGFIAEFGLLLLPIFLLSRYGLTRTRRGPKNATGTPAADTGNLDIPGENSELPHWISGAALILAINTVDMVPNATLTPMSWLFTGALLGLIESVKSKDSNKTIKQRLRTIL